MFERFKVDQKYFFRTARKNDLLFIFYKYFCFICAVCMEFWTFAGTNVDNVLKCKKMLCYVQKYDKLYTNTLSGLYRE